jgi:cytoskeleton protein RodZ
MNAETQRVGSSLKVAREAAGMTVEQAAARLRLMHRQVLAMEEDDFAALGQPVFARGFVRNYARMLGLDAEALVERLGEAGLEAPHKIENLPAVPQRSLFSSPIYLWMAAAFILLVGLPVGLYLWLNSGDDSTPTAARSAAGPIGQVAAPAPAAVNPSSAVAPAAPAAEPASSDEPPPAAEPASSAEPPPAAEPANSAEPSPAAEPANSAEPSPAAEPAKPAKPAKLAEPPVPDTATRVKPITHAAPAAPRVDTDEAAAPAVHSSIRLDFDADAWVEITEVNGRTLFHRLGAAGTNVTLTGTPPFSFVIGNAAHVRMSYNGRPLDLTPYIDVKVARFDLEE